MTATTQQLAKLGRSTAAALAAVFMLAATNAHAELKIAVLDTQRAIFETEAVKGRLEKAGEELKRDQEEAQSLQKEVQSLQERLAKDQEVMSGDAQRDAQKQIENKQIELQFLVNKLQKAVQDQREGVFREMLPRVDAVVKDLIEIEGYDLVAERQNFYYVNTKHDITRRVTEQLNANASR